MTTKICKAETRNWRNVCRGARKRLFRDVTYRSYCPPRAFHGAEKPFSRCGTCFAALPYSLCHAPGKALSPCRKARLAWRETLFERAGMLNALCVRELSESLKTRVFASGALSACEKTLLARLTLNKYSSAVLILHIYSSARPARRLCSRSRAAVQ